MKRFNSLFVIILFVLNGISVSYAQQYGSIMHDGQQRDYIYYSAENSAVDLSLLIVMHGFTQTAENIMQYSQFNQLAESEGFAVVYPQGIGNSWNVDFNGGSTADDLGFIAALIDSLSENYAIDLNRIYATGFSNGGFMSYRLAYQLSNKIAAIASVAGTISSNAFQSWSPELPVPVLHIHGTADFIVPYAGFSGIEGVEALLNFWITHNGCASPPEITDLPDLVQEGSTVTLYEWMNCNSDKQIDLLKINNGGHTWPGANGSGIGNVNQDISASEEIWNFVKQFSLGSAVGMHSQNSANFYFYPNPVFGNKLWVNNIPRNSKSIKLTDLFGNVILEQAITAHSLTLELQLPRLKPGIYLITLCSGNYSAVKKMQVL